MGVLFTRRDFLKVTGTTILALSLTSLKPRSSVAEEAVVGPQGYIYRSWEDLYREKWRWDKVTKGTHCVDCYPGNCAWHVYVRDGLILREEQQARYPVIEPGVPDMNPRGCQKGASFSKVTYGAERVLYPLKRVGERGQGKWKRVSWDEALAAIADQMIATIEEKGPESIVFEMGPGNIGIFQALSVGRFATTLGATTLDVDALIGDFNVGNYITYGKFQHCSSQDDWFHAELTLIWHMNPVYTRIPGAHYITEGRYHGAEVVSIAPDYNASSIHADLYVPVNFGCDAALALGMCNVIVSENLHNAAFVKEQTDLPLLVRRDTEKFLRQSDLESGGRDDQFYFLDATSAKIVQAPRGTLKLEGVDPALEGTVKVKLRDGKEVTAEPVFALLKEHLKAYTPEQASKLCGTSPQIIRLLAKKVASKRTNILMGWNSNKYYHGDLMERSMALLLGLTGNWGKKGTGNRGWNESGDPKEFTFGRNVATVEEYERLEKLMDDLNEKIRAQDPTMTDEMVAIERDRLTSSLVGTVPPVFYWYHHAGYREVWNKKEWSDPSMKRSFDDYYKEALEKGWWEGYVLPEPTRPPEVLFGLAGSTLRRTRGGYKQLLQHLWPKLKLIVTVDPRMSTTALYSDYVLPVAWFYERPDFRFFTPHVTFNTFTDKAVDPLGESLTEFEIFGRLAKTISERAKAQGLEEYKRTRAVPKALISLAGGTLGALLSRLAETEIGERVIRALFPGQGAVMGRTRRFDRIYSRYTYGEQIKENEMEKALELFAEDGVREGLFPPGSNLEKYRKDGFVRFTGLGKYDPVSLNVAGDIKPNETVSCLTFHTEKKIPYPTLTRRAQFYIDHDWFLEAGEALPVHKPNPAMGGNYPFRMTSGHQRWSIHSIWVTNKALLMTHRGQPFMFMNPEDAKKKGIKDGEVVKVFNDFSSFKVSVKLSGSARPGQVIIYHAWEPYQFPGQVPYDAAIPGMVKWLHLAGDYGHLKYWRWNWQPQQADRAVAVDVQKI